MQEGMIGYKRMKSLLNRKKRIRIIKRILLWCILEGVILNCISCQKTEELLITGNKEGTKINEDISMPEIKESVSEETEEYITTVSAPAVEMTNQEKPRPAIYTSGLIGYWEHEFNPFRTSIVLKNELEEVLMNGAAEEYLLEHESDYICLNEEEIQYYIDWDESGVLLFFCEDMEKYAMKIDWFYFKRDGDIIVRVVMSENEFVYFKFPKYPEQKTYGWSLRAMSENEDYYFIEWDEEDYVVVTRRGENGEIEGITTYCIFEEACLGWALCQSKTEEGIVKERYYYCVSVGNGNSNEVIDWPEY